MMRFVENPNLPRGKVSSVICGELCDELNDYLDNLGIERLVIESNNFIDPAVRLHADMAVLHVGGNRIIVDKNQTTLIEKLRRRKFIVIETENEIAGEYPEDIALNFTIIGNKVLGNFSYADRMLIHNIVDEQHINVRQGYCKCSCLVVDDNALITDDKSIYDKAIANEIDCLLISKGDIKLVGHEYGFIGGASCKLSGNEILFFGDITKHRDYKKIADFIDKYGCKIISLDFPFTDFGGIIPIIEETP